MSCGRNGKSDPCRFLGSFHDFVYTARYGKYKVTGLEEKTFYLWSGARVPLLEYEAAVGAVSVVLEETRQSLFAAERKWKENRNG